MAAHGMSRLTQLLGLFMACNGVLTPPPPFLKFLTLPPPVLKLFTPPAHVHVSEAIITD